MSFSLEPGIHLSDRPVIVPVETVKIVERETVRIEYSLAAFSARELATELWKRLKTWLTHIVNRIR